MNNLKNCVFPKRIFWFLIGFTLLLLFINFTTLSIKASNSTDYKFTEDVQKAELSNGITVLLRENPAFDIVALAAVSNVGYKHEPQEMAGLNYLSQNMLLTGTDNRTSAEIDEDIESLGINFDASTSYEYSILSLQTTTNTFRDGLEIYFDLWKNSVFAEEELESEKNFAQNELDARKDNPVNEAVFNFLELYYDDHPYGQPIEGSREGHQAIEVEHVKEWNQIIYNPENIVISVVGNIDIDDTVNILEEKIGNWTVNNNLNLKPEEPEFNPPQENQQKTVERITEASWLILGHGAPSALEKDSAAMRVLNAILGEGMDSRLFRNIREEGLAYSTGSSYESFYGPAVMFTFTGTQATQVENVQSKIKDELARFVEDQVKKEELNNAREYIKGQFLIDNETCMSQAVSMAAYEVMDRGYSWLDEYPSIIDQVTAEDIKEVADEYFNAPVIDSRVLEGDLGL